MDLETKGALIGIVLGDGTLSKIGYKRRNSHISTSSTCEEWVKWKAQYISRITRVRYNVCKNEMHKNWKPVYKATSMQHPAFTKLRMRMYHNNNRAVDNYILRSLTPLGVFIWYLDDGSFYEKQMQIQLSTCAYSYADNLLIAKHMNDRFGLRFNIYQKYRKANATRHCTLHLAAKDKLKFYTDILEPHLQHVPIGMKYKVPQKERLEYLYNRSFK